MPMPAYLPSSSSHSAHESVGGMPVNGGSISFTSIAKAAGYTHCFFAEDEKELLSVLPKIHEVAGSHPAFLEIAVKQGSRPDLGRPTATPRENLRQLMAYLNTQGEKA